MKRAMVATFFSSVLLLSACSGSTPGEQLDTVLKDTFEAEQEYRQVQSELEELEQTEQETFESIMGLTQEQQDEVITRAEEAIASVDERLALLQTEKESIESAEETFKEIDTVIEEVEEEDIKNDLEALKTKMQERFEAHADFAAEYEELAGLQKELYEMLKGEETDLQTLQEKTAEVNEQNTIVQDAVTVFNEQTKQFNEMKNDLIEKLQQSEQ